MSRRGRFYARDQRTTRLERAVSLIEDGHYKNILVKKGTQDREHPLDRPVIPGLDRVQIKAGRNYKETQTGRTIINVGYEAGAESNFIRPGVDALKFAETGGTVTFQTPIGGYGEFGYGAYGYGGTGGDEEAVY